MNFETQSPDGSPDYVAEWLLSLSEVDREKIKKKLRSWGMLTLSQLKAARHIVHLENELHEVRIRHTNPEYRLLGYILGDTFYAVHVAPKKGNKLPRKAINTARNRIKSITT